jgi:hypothetical protein
VPFISLFKPDSAQQEPTQLERKLTTYIRNVLQMLCELGDMVLQGYDGFLKNWFEKF